MGVDDLKEAIEKGYLGGKLVTPKTIKFMDAMLDAVSIYAEAESISDVDWMRNAIAEALVTADAKYERTRKAKERASKHWNTLAHQKESPVAGTTELDIHNLEGNEQ
ncbi:hypothetical protein [Acinetobacter pseudolwoffii]|uniref:hypothetical protein n=1 Tax=Acinetobacter pseudolwoffii TaxID=2053287 RepID=UPI00246949FF|nr:hypothetical protein [Acinetobacter pseudolwoffii]MDH5819531.1 hypothetical protein [Acinetobacter pseudolwoffii]